MTQLAHETGFQKRAGGRLAPYDFLVLLTLGQLGMKHPSLEGMSAALPTRISREALHQRFTAPARGVSPWLPTGGAAGKVTPSAC